LRVMRSAAAYSEGMSSIAWSANVAWSAIARDPTVSPWADQHHDHAPGSMPPAE
jgi:hypothetical protein